MATPLWQLRIDRIVTAVEQLDVDNIRRHAAELRMQTGEPSHELAWWNQTMFVDRELRRTRRSREAALAARRAVAALEAAATRSGIGADDPDVACIADNLRTMARATVVGFAEPFGAGALELAGTPLQPPSIAWPHALTARRTA